jgi:RimJ/RimL family protein N-acetyltransferase
MDETQARVGLRPVGVGDLGLLEREAVDRETRGQANWWGFRDAGSVRRQFEANGFLGDDGGHLIVQLGQEPIGTVSWHAVHHGPGPWSRCWNIGIALLPAYRGHGYGGAAQRALAEYLLANTTAMRIEASTRSDNLAEQRALEKAGFRREGVLRSAQFHDGAWRDLVLFSLVRADLQTG